MREIQLVLQPMTSSGWSEVSYPKKLTTSYVKQERHHRSTLTKCTFFTETLGNVLSWTAIPKVLPLTPVKSNPWSVSMCCHYLGLQLMHLPRPDFSFLPVCQFSQSMYCYTECIFLTGYSPDASTRDSSPTKFCSSFPVLPGTAAHSIKQMKIPKFLYL